MGFRWKGGLILIAIILFVPSLLTAEEPITKLRITESAICRNVVNRTPVDVSDRFPSTVGKVYTFTRVVGAEGETVVKHLWFYGDRLMAEVTLPVRSANWRTYSSKIILPGWKGKWRVDITTEDGILLKSLEFVIE